MRFCKAIVVRSLPVGASETVELVGVDEDGGMSFVLGIPTGRDGVKIEEDEADD